MSDKQTRQQLTEYLQSGLSQFWRTLHQRDIEKLVANWWTSLKQRKLTRESEILETGFELLAQQLESNDQKLTSLRNRHRVFISEMAIEPLLANRHKLILEFCAYLGNSKRRSDKRALRRWLDEAAVLERWNSRVKDLEFQCAFLIKRLAALFDLLVFAADAAAPEQLWHELRVEARLTSWIRYEPEVNVQLAAFQSISSILQSTHQQHHHLISSELLRYTYRFALDDKRTAGLQIEALNLLAFADLNKAKALIAKRLARRNEHGGSDEQHIFFFEAISEVICLHCLADPDIIKLSFTLAQDPSPLVRQSVVKTLSVNDDTDLIRQLVTLLKQDSSDAVYCYLVTQLPFVLQDFDFRCFYLEQLHQQQSHLRLRAICTGLCSWLAGENKSDPTFRDLLQVCEQSLLTLSQQHESPAIQHLMIATRETIWAQQQNKLSKLLKPILDNHETHCFQLDQEQQAAIASKSGKRWLAAHIGHQFTLQIHDKTVRKGELFAFRWWRFLYELRHPATDKRQHHSHVTGRLYRAKDIIPSATQAEVSQTTVPGEPLHQPKEGHWRPFLPLVDHFISALSLSYGNKPMCLYHVFGTTEITPPKSLFTRLKARMKLNWHFSSYARLRNVAWDDQQPQRYITAMRALGFTIEQNGHPLLCGEQQHTPHLPAVSRFFDMAVPLTLPVAVVQFYQDFQRYFVSVYQNTINHILLFTVVMVALFWGSHAAISRQFKKAREQIPMTIGGWGTRGKSGTERLKAALVNSQGLSTLSKTTGCEAMFLYATRYGPLKEMFLFRPYDKATIWEQTFVVRLAAKLRSDVFCWECMGLTPRYIDILQQQWMQDDFITITNCFPDHEDLQGPAGIDVPQVIAKFIAPGARVWTTEENMLAYLEREAAIKQANLHKVDWLEIATIPEDLLTRFPYEEHPANIALVAKMASEMQLTRTMAIKEMADRVVPDIGVLQVFPYANINSRKMRFINGMSANERYAALNNWQRLNYHQTERQHNGDYLLTTVINNRADRVPRSKVFARLIAYDFSTSCHFVIGNNLDGFHGLAMEAWNERCTATLKANMSVREFNQSYCSLLDFLMVAQDEPQLLRRMSPSGIGCGESYGTVTSLNDNYGTVTALKAQLGEQGSSIDSVTQTFWLKQVEHCEHSKTLLLSEQSQVTEAHLKSTFDWLEQVFSDKMILVNDYTISGDALNQLIADSLPQNTTIDILGLQNIKGPGLDFVYSWQQWHQVHSLINQILNSFGEETQSLLAELKALPKFTCLEQEALQQFVEQMQTQEQLLTTNVKQYLDSIKQLLDSQNHKQNADVAKPSRLQPLFAVLEECIDIFDAVRRGRQANRILVDLANQRISLNNAAHELKKINKRQKGGWLLK